MNLSLQLLKLPLRDPEMAVEQGQAAVRLLVHFGEHPGKVVVVQLADGKDTSSLVRTSRCLPTKRRRRCWPRRTTYYRCGSADTEARNYSHAAFMFQQSREHTLTPAPLTTKRLMEDRRQVDTRRALGTTEFD
jgi:hypothetical protein